MPNRYICEITASERMTDTAFAMTVNCGELAGEVHPGQFIHIKCGEERLLRRPISICRADADTLEFVFEIKGEGTRWLAERKPGDRLDILGPLGNGFALPESGNIIAISGGIGVPPMLFAAQSATGGVTALLGFRDDDKVILTQAFAEVCDTVRVITDDKGYVTDLLEEELNNGAHSAVIACGPRAMLKAVAEICKRHNVPCQVSLEERMGCGVGACLVCACATQIDGKDHMRRVCKDGPVFNAAEVVW
ncbi:MAG: dihydroorotate dehydrogenase electron transfer subunit [Oscillospiraceae bacterium]|nr:dihydroorotate dehydrogenase electron transfer subunit [Oscillospiraceae bacterium]